MTLPQFLVAEDSSEDEDSASEADSVSELEDEPDSSELNLIKLSMFTFLLLLIFSLLSQFIGLFI